MIPRCDCTLHVKGSRAAGLVAALARIELRARAASCADTCAYRSQPRCFATVEPTITAVSLPHFGPIRRSPDSKISPAFAPAKSLNLPSDFPRTGTCATSCATRHATPHWQNTRPGPNGPGHRGAPVRHVPSRVPPPPEQALGAITLHCNRYRSVAPPLLRRGTCLPAARTRGATCGLQRTDEVAAAAAAAAARSSIRPSVRPVRRCRAAPRSAGRIERQPPPSPPPSPARQFQTGVHACIRIRTGPERTLFGGRSPTPTLGPSLGPYSSTSVPTNELHPQVACDQ